MLRLLVFLVWSVLVNRALEKLEEAEMLRLAALLASAESEPTQDENG